MDDITPLNLQDSPKLFGLRYDQLVAIIISLCVSSQIYAWMNPVMVGGNDLRLYICLFLFLLGPVYCLVTMNSSSSQWENIANFFFTSQVLIPGPDPNPVRFLTDETLTAFYE